MPWDQGKGLPEEIDCRLPYKLTQAQQRVFEEVTRDMHEPVPMLRLVQGDVGSGKTVVAALSALRAIEAGKQVALMAPTELLAEQHLANFRAWFEPLGIKVMWLAGKVTGKARAAALAQLASGEAQMIIGTHALMQEKVVFIRRCSRYRRRTNIASACISDWLCATRASTRIVPHH